MKKIVAILLSMFMLLNITPVRTFAETSITVTKSDGSSAIEGTYNSGDINHGDYAWSGNNLYIGTNDLVVSGQDNTETGYIVIHGSVERITLKNLFIKGNIRILGNANSLTMNLVGDNQIGASVNYQPGIPYDSYTTNEALVIEKDLTIDGEGSLTIYDLRRGIAGNANLVFKDTFTGLVTIEDAGAGDPEPQPPCAISIENNELIINGGTLKLTSYQKNAITAGKIKINGGEVFAKGYLKAMSVAPDLGPDVSVMSASENFDGTVLVTYNKENTDYKYLHFKTNVTVADVLPEDFPTAKLNAWINLNLDKMYLSNNYLYINDEQILPVNTVIDFNGNSYEYTTNGIKYIFYLTEEKCNSIYISGYKNEKAVYNGYFKKANIMSVLSTNPDAPKPLSDGWVNMTDNNKQLSFFMTSYKVGNQSPFLTSDQMIESNAYSPYTSSYSFTNNDGITIKINVSNKVAQNVEISGFTEENNGLNGTYIPTHKIIDAPSSILTNQIEDTTFVSNAVYFSEDDVTVKIDSDLTPLELNVDYTLSHGSTHVTLKSDYLSSLSLGMHTLHISVNGYPEVADKEFTIVEYTPTPSADSAPRYVAPKTGIE